MSTNMGDIDVAQPSGATKKVFDLDDHQRDHRNANKVTWDVEHSVENANKAGKHMFPIVTNAQEAALTNNTTGRIVQNTTKTMLRYYDGADWQDCIGAVFASGVRLVFDQDAAPTGWTRDTSYNDKVIRVVSGARADGGSWTISGLTNATEAAHTHSTPNHAHPMAESGTQARNNSDIQARSVIQDGGFLKTFNHGSDTTFPKVTNDTTSSGSGTSGGGSAHGHTISSGGAWRPLHRDMIVAEKD